ncbi:MAG: M20/M25/M40 family metallo-hydrolase [Christensenellaceae bacterium]|jgi:carboxypeptidase PM20D1|nr:M20/M25/M40 family metallo-hydrolase [Christensenellaceae bacterium]
MVIILYSILGLIGALITFMVIRTVLTKPIPVPKSEFVPNGVDKDLVAQHLSGAVQFETVTLTNPLSETDVFFKLQEYIEKCYPCIFERAKKTLINRYSVIYVVEGTDKDLLPIAMLAHQDVVPAPIEGWIVPPFSGEIKDGYVYGRGSQDMKSQMIASLEGLEILLKDGFIPKRTIYFCFGHDEELRGTEGAKQISKYLQDKGIRFEYVLDEGGTILDGKMLGIDNKIALIGICEKGYADFILEVEKPGGHASSPTRRTAVGLLAEAVYFTELSQRPTFFAKPTKDMFKALAPYMKPIFKFLFVNRDILSPLLRLVLSKAHPMTNSLVRTTITPTMAKGADAPNVLPPRASANINCRINTGETIELIHKHIKKVVGKNVKVRIDDGSVNPSEVSDITSPGYNILKKTIAEVYNGYITAPFLFIAATDSKHYYPLSKNVYRFTPFEKTEDDASRIHGINERQDINALAVGVEFYIRLYQNSCN